MNARPISVFTDKKAKKCLSYLNGKYVVVPANKSSNCFCLKNYYYGYLIKEFGIPKNSGNITYKNTTQKTFGKSQVILISEYSEVAYLLYIGYQDFT